MKIRVIYKKNFGVEMFYPEDEWTKKLLSVFHAPCIKTKSFSRRQIDGLRDLGFTIEATQEKVKI